MNNLKLNLGQFNRCVDYLPNRHKFEFSKDSSTEVFYYSSTVTDKVVSVQFTDEYITIPTVDFSAANDECRMSDPDMVQSVLACIELKVFAAIKKVLDKVDQNLEFKNIYIPISNVQIFDTNLDDKINGCYGWAEVGIVVRI